MSEETNVKEETKQNEGTLFVPATEILKYLSDLVNVLTIVVKGIEDSKDALVKKSETKGEANDGNKD